MLPVLRVVPRQRSVRDYSRLPGAQVAIKGRSQFLAVVFAPLFLLIYRFDCFDPFHLETSAAFEPSRLLNPVRDCKANWRISFS